MAKTPTEIKRDELRKRLNEGPKVSSIDGMATTPAQEDAINDACAAIFKTMAGKTVLAYLRRITVDRIAGREINPNVLLHMEGGRWLYGVLEQRNELGKLKK